MHPHRLAGHRPLPGPTIGGAEPKFQAPLVNLLFTCLVVIVVGSLAGQWLSVQQRLGGDLWYWFGRQGYEYVDLGRFWQIFLFAGLFIWLGLMLRPTGLRSVARTSRARSSCSSSSPAPRSP